MMFLEETKCGLMRTRRKVRDPYYLCPRVLFDFLGFSASCDKCNFNSAYFYQLQIRSADEPMTTCAFIFFDFLRSELGLSAFLPKFIGECLPPFGRIHSVTVDFIDALVVLTSGAKIKLNECMLEMSHIQLCSINALHGSKHPHNEWFRVVGLDS